jgi:hypothetical protein
VTTVCEVGVNHKLAIDDQPNGLDEVLRASILEDVATGTRFNCREHEVTVVERAQDLVGLGVGGRRLRQHRQRGLWCVLTPLRDGSCRPVGVRLMSFRIR